MVPLLVQRGTESDPDPRTTTSFCEPGDELLFAGRSAERRLLETTLFDDSASEYVLYDRHVPASWVWRKITRAKQQTPATPRQLTDVLDIRFGQRHAPGRTAGVADVVGVTAADSVDPWLERPPLPRAPTPDPGAASAPRSGTGPRPGRTPARGPAPGGASAGRNGVRRRSPRPAGRGPTGSKSAVRPTRTPSQPPYEPSPVVTAIKGIGRGLKRLWLVGARWLGSMVRAIGRGAAATKEIDPVHRRDGIAFGLIALAVVCAIGTWLQAAGPVGGAGR